MRRGRRGRARRSRASVSANRAGYGFLRVEGFKESIFLPPPEMRGVMHGDRLRVKVSRDSSDRWSGTVEQVARARRHRLPRHGGDPGAQRLGERRGPAPAAALRGFAGGPARGARGRLGDRADHTTRRLRLAGAGGDRQAPGPGSSGRAGHRVGNRAFRSCRMSSRTAALREAQACGERVDPREAATRVDLRELPLVTIDGEDARDFDDAVYAESAPRWFSACIVAIADVSHYVRPGTALDTEAQSAARRSIFRRASCRCCRPRCPTTCARSRRTSTVFASSPTW